MRVLSVQHYPVFGGPHNEIIRLEPELNARGIESIVALADEPGNALQRLTPYVEVRSLPLSRARRSIDPRLNSRAVEDFRNDIQRLRGVIRRERADLVKVHGPHNPQGAIAASLEDVPVVWVISSTRVPIGFRRVGIQLVKRLASAVLVTGRALLDSYPDGTSLESRAFAYYPPVDIAAFSPLPEPDRDAIRAELDIPAAAPVVGTVANVNPQKGIETFLRAATEIRVRVENARFLIVGAHGGAQLAYFEKVKRAATAANLWPTHLEFLGDRSDVARLLGAFDVSTVTSVPRSEGMPTTALEAMSCGIPVVSTAVGAVHEAIDDGRTGYVVAATDASALAQRIVSLLLDPQLSQAMGRAARQRAVERFSTQSCVDVHVRAYEYAARAASRPSVG